VRLPAGRYRVVGDLGGRRLSASVDVKPGVPATVALHWPDDPA
jgi:hypothetical protein